MTQLFPKEIIENSQEANFSKHSVVSKIIYSTIIVFLICAIALLPFIHMDVGVRSQGFIRPVTEVLPITSAESGNVKILNASENQFVSKGDLLAVLDAPHLKEQIRFNLSRQNLLKGYLDDLKILQNAETASLLTSIDVASARYQRDFLMFRQQLLNQQNEITQINRSLSREKHLFDQGAISEAAYDESFYAFQTAKNNYKLLIDQQRNNWKLDKISFQDEIDQLQSEYSQIIQQLNRFEIRSPISGTFQNVSGIFQNSFIYANQVLGEISPDTTLIAEAYVSPRDIGLLKEGMAVRMQIDAYNYNQWGIATGKIQSISTDMIMQNQQPVFKVRCTIDQTYLHLQNGFKGDIKKGMTFQSRFIVSRRSLFQLLYDKVDDWLNPNWSENEYAVEVLNQQ